MLCIWFNILVTAMVNPKAAKSMTVLKDAMATFRLPIALLAVAAATGPWLY